MIAVRLDNEVREYGREAWRFGLWVWSVRANHIAFGQPFVPPYFFSGGRVAHYWADRAALYGDAESREVIFLKIGLAVARDCGRDAVSFPGRVEQRRDDFDRLYRWAFDRAVEIAERAL